MRDTLLERWRSIRNGAEADKAMLYVYTHQERDERMRSIPPGNVDYPRLRRNSLEGYITRLRESGQLEPLLRSMGIDMAKERLDLRRKWER